MPPAFALSQDQTLKFIQTTKPKLGNPNKPTSTHLHKSIPPIAEQDQEHMHNASSSEDTSAYTPNIDPAGKSQTHT
jgi:hypothetical protein